MCSSLLVKISSTHNDCLAVGWSDVDFSWRSFVMPMCLQLEKKGHQNQKLFLLMKNIWKVLLSVALNNSPLQRSLTANFTKHPRTNRLFKQVGVSPSCVLLHIKAMNPSLHAITERIQTVGAGAFFLFFVFFLFFLTILYRRTPPLEGVCCQSVTFLVPSVSSRRFLFHRCTTHFLCILSKQGVPLY